MYHNLIHPLLKVGNIYIFIYTYINIFIFNIFIFLIITASNFDSVEATPLESLPGHMNIFEHSKSNINIKEKKHSNSLQHQGLSNLFI